MLGRRPVRRLVDRAPRLLPLVLIAALVAGTAVFATATPADAAAGPKVVIVVGPTHGATTRYLQRARRIAAQARSYGARVVQVYTPKATWARVQAAARGARVFIYLGHGNGSPSPYGPMRKSSMNGLGLNPTSGAHRKSPVQYYGEAFIQHLDLAPGAVVLLNHLCYASGNGEPGMREPSWNVARRRVDNFAAGFIRAGARAVLADGHTDLSYELRIVLETKGDLIAAWRADPAYHSHERKFSSARSKGYLNLIDPDTRTKGFYRSLTTRRGFSTRTWHSVKVTPKVVGKRLEGFATTSLKLRAAASTTGGLRATIADSARMVVTAQIVLGRDGRTWAAVRTTTKRVGYVAAWLLTYRGSVVSKATIALRAAGTSAAKVLGNIPKGARVTVIGTKADAHDRVWFRIRTGTGRVGWVAGWQVDS